MGYRITGLDSAPFAHLYGTQEMEMATMGVLQNVVDAENAIPDRIEMRDGHMGETMLLLDHVCQDAESPYRASHATFIRERAEALYEAENVVPTAVFNRLLSLHGFDAEGMMEDADVATGAEIAQVILRIFENSQVAYIHAHNAKQGCYAGRMDRG